MLRPWLTSTYLRSMYIFKKLAAVHNKKLNGHSSLDQMAGVQFKILPPLETLMGNWIILLFTLKLENATDTKLKKKNNCSALVT
jgi:hypothetical protein